MNKMLHAVTQGTLDALKVEVSRVQCYLTKEIKGRLAKLREFCLPVEFQHGNTQSDSAFVQGSWGTWFMLKQTWYSMGRCKVWWITTSMR